MSNRPRPVAARRSFARTRNGLARRTVGLVFHQRSRGQALVELALVVPVLLLLLLAALDLGRVYYSQITVANSAREGAFEAGYHPTQFNSGAACSTATKTSNSIMCAITKEALNSDVAIAPSDVTVSCSPSCARGASPANRVTVTVSGHFSFLTPLLSAFFGGSNVTLTSAATADIVNVPPPNGNVGGPSGSPSSSPSASASASPSASASASPSPVPTPTCAPPIPAFTYSQQNKNKPVDFVSTSSPTSGNCAITYWRWDYGDNSTDAGNLPTVSHDFPAKGTTYTVMLSVTNPGSTMTYTTTVTTK